MRRRRVVKALDKGPAQRVIVSLDDNQYRYVRRTAKLRKTTVARIIRDMIERQRRDVIREINRKHALGGSDI
jgi:hypothetical protein